LFFTAAKQRLLAQAKAVNDAGRGFGDLANISVQHPDDASTFNKLADAARKLASLTGQLVGTQTLMFIVDLFCNRYLQVMLANKQQCKSCV
jgi:hypothetical protein